MTRRPLHQFLFALLLVCGVVWLSACATTPSTTDDPLAWRRDVYHRLQENLSLPVSARLQVMPDTMFATLQKSDRAIGIAGVDAYRARAATAPEQVLFARYLELLPPLYQRVFQRKLLGVFIIDDFAGAGLSEWVVDDQAQGYYYLVLNSALFGRSLDDWLSYKEDSMFDNSAPQWQVRVRTGTDYRALLYGLLHEGAHIIDYDQAVTPYVEQDHRQALGRSVADSAFVTGDWLQQDQPVAAYDFTHRKDLNIYGIFARRGLVARDELPGMYEQLRNTPFVSFYSGVSWNEQLADSLTYLHIESTLGGTVVSEVLQDGRVVAQRRPLRSPLVAAKAATLSAFYLP